MVGVFQSELIDNGTAFGSHIVKRKNALISCDSILFHKENSLGSELLRKDDIVVVLQVVGQISLISSIDERIREVNREENISNIIKILIDLIWSRANTWQITAIAAFSNGNFESIRGVRGVLTLDVKIMVPWHAKPTMHL